MKRYGRVRRFLQAKEARGGKRGKAPFLTGCQVVKLKVTPLCHRLGECGRVQRPDTLHCHSGGGLSLILASSPLTCLFDSYSSTQIGIMALYKIIYKILNIYKKVMSFHRL